MQITITDKAAVEIKRITGEQTSDSLIYLRLRVQGGGCSGFTHKLDLTEDVSETTDIMLIVSEVPVVVDKRSALYLDGAVVDYQNDINSRGFTVKNPSARSVCGCGSSFTM